MLTRELIELPGKFETFRAEMTQAMSDLARVLTATNERLIKLKRTGGTCDRPL